MSHEGLSKWESFVWKRPSDVYGEGNFVVYDTPDPNDIQQGALGDCYFLSVLSMLAENPHRVRKLFAHHEILPEGIYGVNLTKNGEKVDHIENEPDIIVIE